MAIEPKKRINSQEFAMILYNIPDFSEKDKAYLKKAFEFYLEDGLTEWELRDKIGKLSFNENDGIDKFELEKLKNKVLAALGK